METNESSGHVESQGSQLSLKLSVVNGSASVHKFISDHIRVKHTRVFKTLANSIYGLLLPFMLKQ